MEVLTIRELNERAGPQAEAFAIRAQLDSLLRKDAKSGKPFYELKFADAEETLLLRAWDDTPVFAAAEAKTVVQRGFYQLEGQWYRNAERGTIDPKTWSARPLENEEIAALLNASGPLQERQAHDYQYLVDTTNSLGDPRLRGLCQRLLAKFGTRLKRTAGARGYHHARRGGLVEHVAQMMRMAVKTCEAYNFLNRDLLVTGVLFHDIGKLWENCYLEKGFSMPYTEVSELISHIPMGMEIVNRLWRELQDEPGGETWITLDPPSDQVRMHLLHLVASHHGELEFGAPVVPKTPEAAALHYIDNLDAKMEMFHKGYGKSTEIGKNVFQRVRPLPGNLVRPLPKFDGIGEGPPPPVNPDVPTSAPELEPEPLPPEPTPRPAPTPEPTPEPVDEAFPDPEPAPAASAPQTPEPRPEPAAPLSRDLDEMEDPF
jgi:3'-5' exoribonuclease